MNILLRRVSAVLLIDSKPSVCSATYKANVKLSSGSFHCNVLGGHSTAAAAVQVAPCGKKLSMRWEGRERELVFHGVWLRHNCQCPKCLSYSGQKTLDETQLDPDMTIAETSVEEGALHVKFSCGHAGHISLEWLRENCYPASQDSPDLMRNQPKVASSMPVMSAIELEHDEGLWRWLMYLNEYGICLLKDIPTEPNDQILKVAQKVYHPQKTIYGEMFDVIATENPVNIAYSSLALGYHMDLVYYESPPGLQLLHCIRFDSSVEGGESIMLDALPVVEQLKEKHPHHFHTLTRVPATFQKVHFEREKPVLMRYQRPHIAVDCRGKVVAVTWSPQFEGPLSVPEQDVEDYYAAYTCLKNLFDQSKLKFVHRLLPGEAMTFNNRRYLHSRRDFKLNGGVRHLKGVYVNIDEFKSQYAVLCSQLNKKECQVKHVFNHCTL